jgi:hypothetical protein
LPFVSTQNIWGIDSIEKALDRMECAPIVRR